MEKRLSFRAYSKTLPKVISSSLKETLFIKASSHFSSTCGLCSEYKTDFTDVIEDELSPSAMSCRDIYDFCPKIGFTCDEPTTRAMCSETCNVCGTNFASENGDSNVNCFEWKNFCDLPFVRKSCSATCEGSEANFSGDDESDFSGEGSGDGM